MKTTLHLLTLAMVIFSFNQAEAQKANYTTRGGITLGFGMGGAYQQSDIANSRGIGYDFTFGSQLYKREGAFFSADWKFRFLAGENKAHDHRINLDNTYTNIDYKFFNYDLELGLSLNRLRERTRIVITGFAGAGITHGRTFADLYDENSSLYDYSIIDQNQNQELIYDDLLSMTDNDYETRLENKAAVLPTAGIYIGYQFSPSFSLGIEHKTNFSLTEQNSFTGFNMDNRILTASNIDKNHYTTLGFKWKLGRKPASSHSSYTESYVPNSPVIIQPSNTTTNTTTTTTLTTVSENLPTVKIIDPESNPYHTSSNFISIKADIRHANAYDAIVFYQDGIPKNNFTYNNYTHVFTANVNLREGANYFRIKATNTAGSAEDRLKVIMEKGVTMTATSPPRAEFTSPSGSRFNSDRARIDISAHVQNVSNKGNIQLSLNGRSSVFNYHSGSGTVDAVISLEEGTNTLLISVSNLAGTASDQLSILYNKAVQLAPPPVVNFINPETPISVQNKSFLVRAHTRNLRTRNDITLIINGIRTENFNFSPTGEVNTNLNLLDGVNTIEIIGRNESGQSSDRTTIQYNKVIRMNPPLINIIIPRTNPYHTNESLGEVRATISNIKTKENITIRINNVNSGNFSFNSSTQELVARYGLREGQNSIKITAQNEAGRDVKSQTIIKELKPCPSPEIRLSESGRDMVSTEIQSYTFRAEVFNIAKKSQLRLSLNGLQLPFNYTRRTLSYTASLISGVNSFILTAKNDCGEVREIVRVNYNPKSDPPPCHPPTVNFNLEEVNHENISHQLRGNVQNIKNKSDIMLLVNGRADHGFQFVPTTGSISAKYKFKPGITNVVVSARNNCGSDSKSVSVSVAEPCQSPTVNFSLNPVNRTDATHDLKGTVLNIKNKTDIRLLVNRRTDQGFQFVPATGVISAKYKFNPGTTKVAITIQNECGSDSKSVSVSVAEPCQSPTVNFSLNPVNRTDATHELKGTVINIKNKTDIRLLVNGRADQGFQFVPATGVISAKYKFNPGTTKVAITVQNECGSDSKNVSVNISEEKEDVACGPRINPGNMEWQFCLVTAKGTYNRENLENKNFSYSGTATSLFFMPIAGGGDALVNGKPYSLRPGQYYLFTGRLKVSVSTKNPGSMGHWSVCIETDMAPVFGQGNNRPVSPCEGEDDKTKPDRGGR